MNFVFEYVMCMCTCKSLTSSICLISAISFFFRYPINWKPVVETSRHMEVVWPIADVAIQFLWNNALLMNRKIYK